MDIDQIKKTYLEKIKKLTKHNKYYYEKIPKSTS